MSGSTRVDTVLVSLSAKEGRHIANSKSYGVLLADSLFVSAYKNCLPMGG